MIKSNLFKFPATKPICRLSLSKIAFIHHMARVQSPDRYKPDRYKDEKKMNADWADILEIGRNKTVSDHRWHIPCLKKTIKSDCALRIRIKAIRHLREPEFPH